VGSRYGSYRSRDPPVALLRGHCLRQFTGDPRGVPREASSHRHELLRDFVGLRRLSGRAGGDAHQCGVRGAGEPLAVHDGLVRCLALAGRSLLHRVHSEPVCNQPGPLLGDHRSLHVSYPDEQETRGYPDRRRMDLLERDLLSRDSLVARRAYRASTGG